MDDRLDELSRALGCRARLSVLSVLAGGDASADELLARVGGTPPDMGDHLAALHEARLISTAPDGRVRLASLHVVTLVRALAAVAAD
jgi:DNA-binding transcriptional ArsR family regulator